MGKDRRKNYLDFIPIRRAEALLEEADDGGMAVLVRENKGLFNFLAQKLLKKPKQSYIHLDEMGSFVLRCIDGERTVYEISGMVHERFGDDAEPLFGRLVQYMRNLEACGFILLR